MRHKRRALWLVPAVLATATPLWARPMEVAAVQSLADLTLEQLSNIEVTSVSGRAETLQDAAASIFVITAQDIRRSTATSLPEVLRLAPNLQVAQASAGTYAITARGTNTAIANKLLVLIDGRTVYSTLFAGVLWDMHDVVLEDIERIEVISGPGGTLWGANAVNGVINIITRSATDTQGSLVSVARSGHGGRETVRWGGRVGAASVRIYGIATDTDNTVRGTGAERDDAWRRKQAGFRADWAEGPSQLTLQGDISRGGDDAASRDSPNQHGGNVLVRWSSRFADGSPYKLQAYTDLQERDELTALRNRSRTQDIEFTHEPQMGEGAQLLWGGGWRRASDTNVPTDLVLLSPVQRDLTWSNLFVQHQHKITPALQLTAGLKAEHNSYTGLEWLPNLRLAFEHGKDNTTWAGLSRAVRAPSRIDREFFFPGRAPFLISGGPNFRSEVATVAELGHRGRWNESLSYSATAFRQHYAGLRAGIPGKVPNTVENAVGGNIDGIEAWGSWQASRDWSLAAGWLTQRTRLRYSAVADARTVFPDLGNDPSHQWSLRSNLNLGNATELDVTVRRVGALPSPVVPAYTAVDARIGVQVSPTLTLSLQAQNLTDKRHVEFEASPAASQIERRVFVKATWKL